MRFRASGRCKLRLSTGAIEASELRPHVVRDALAGGEPAVLVLGNTDHTQGAFVYALVYSGRIEIARSDRYLWKISAVGVELVGVAGFEPATPTSRTWCATRLRYTPTGGRSYNSGTLKRKLE